MTFPENYERIHLGSAYLAQKVYPLSAILWLEECLVIKKNKLQQDGVLLDRVNEKLKLARQLLEEKKAEEQQKDCTQRQ